MPDALSEIRGAIESAFGTQVAAVQPTAGRFDIFTGINYGWIGQADAEFINQP